jgi:hypothetical protein
MSQSAVASLKMLTMDMVAFAMELAASLSSFSRSYILSARSGEDDLGPLTCSVTLSRRPRALPMMALTSSFPMMIS